jgi:hypothetical protein
MQCVFQRNAGAPRRPKGCAEGHKPKPGNAAAVAGTNTPASPINSSRKRPPFGFGLALNAIR